MSYYIIQNEEIGKQLFNTICIFVLFCFYYVNCVLDPYHITESSIMIRLDQNVLIRFQQQL